MSSPGHCLPASLLRGCGPFAIFCMRSASRLQPIGRHGRTHCLGCNSGVPKRERCSRAPARLQASTDEQGWECLRTAPPQEVGGEPGVWDAALAVHTSCRGRVLLPAIRPNDRALLRSQAGPHAGAGLAAIPADPATSRNDACARPHAPRAPAPTAFAPVFYSRTFIPADPFGRLSGSETKLPGHATPAAAADPGFSAAAGDSVRPGRQEPGRQPGSAGCLAPAPLPPLR